MRRASTIQRETEQIMTVEGLTNVFESIASTQVSKVKNKAELSKEFFQLLWPRYTSLRIDPGSRITSTERSNNQSKKVFIIISAASGLSGDIDERLIETMLQDYDPKDTDIIVFGAHGANQLAQRHIVISHYFTVTETDSYIDVSPVIKIVKDYSRIVVYYEEYDSLGSQGIKKIDLISSIKEMSSEAEEGIMTATDTIFEPSLDEIAEQMEETMMSLALSQAILESGLAQSASRFNAMALAKKRALDLISLYKLEYHQAKRAESDRRLREVMISLKTKRRHKGAVR